MLRSVLQRLEEATDRAEAEAAIWAADRFCAQSTQFSPTVFPTIESKLKGGKKNILECFPFYLHCTWIFIY